MRRLEEFMLKIRTGPRGRQDLPCVCINESDFYELEDVEGAATSGNSMSASYRPHKMIQSFVLQGPERGFWDIEETEITYRVREREPYTIKLGPVTLDSRSDLNIWYESPEDTFDV